MHRAPWAVPLFFAATAAAQAFVSPQQATAAEGSRSEQVPFNNSTARRYMQLHGDVPATAPATLARLSFRQNAGNTVNFTGTRAIDMELWLSNSTVRFDRPSTLFAANHSQAPVLAIARRTVTFGPQGPNVTVGPAPFAGMDLVLDAPFALARGTTLVWEAVIHANALTGTFNALDADQSSLTPATINSSGLGCIATGRTLRMILGAQSQDVAGTLVHAIAASLAPANAPCALALGSQNPNQPVPGLCSNLYTDLAILLPMPNTDANGLIQADAGVGLVFDNTFTGLTLYSQLHALDLGRSDVVKICNSDGVAVTMPSSNPTKRLMVTRLFNTLGGTANGRASFAADTMIGYGLVVQFQ